MLDDIERRDIIEDSSASWSSLVVFIGKMNENLRFCVDYKKLNEVTKKDCLPLPRIDDTLDTLVEEIIVHSRPEERLLAGGTASGRQGEYYFLDGSRLWQFILMPFCLCNASDMFFRG
jgi:hypothetical protein